MTQWTPPPNTLVECVRPFNGRTLCYYNGGRWFAITGKEEIDAPPGWWPHQNGGLG